MLVACVGRNCRQLVSVRRTGAGGIRWRCRIRRIVEGAHAVAELEQLALESDVPQCGFSRAIRMLVRALSRNPVVDTGSRRAGG